MESKILSADFKLRQRAFEDWVRENLYSADTLNLETIGMGREICSVSKVGSLHENLLRGNPSPKIWAYPELTPFGRPDPDLIFATVSAYFSEQPFAAFVVRRFKRNLTLLPAFALSSTPLILKAAIHQRLEKYQPTEHTDATWIGLLSYDFKSLFLFFQEFVSHRQISSDDERQDVFQSKLLYQIEFWGSEQNHDLVDECFTAVALLGDSVPMGKPISRESVLTTLSKNRKEPYSRANIIRLRKYFKTRVRCKDELYTLGIRHSIFSRSILQASNGIVEDGFFPNETWSLQDISAPSLHILAQAVRFAFMEDFYWFVEMNSDFGEPWEYLRLGSLMQFESCLEKRSEHLARISPLEECCSCLLILKDDCSSGLLYLASAGLFSIDYLGPTVEFNRLRDGVKKAVSQQARS
ncbi:MAG: hypothetical protein AAGK14_13165 [Verrucomicrobiota bacterium]